MIMPRPFAEGGAAGLTDATSKVSDLSTVWPWARQPMNASKLMRVIAGSTNNLLGDVYCLYLTRIFRVAATTQTNRPIPRRRAISAPMDSRSDGERALAAKG